MIVTITTFSDDLLKEKITKGISLLEPGDTQELPFSLDSQLYEPGVYTIKAQGRYHSYTTNEQVASFRVGQLFVNITDVEIIPYSEQIYKFMITFENFWNTGLDRVYATVAVQHAEETLALVTTPPISLDAWEKETLSTFLDGKSLTPGAYTAEITLFYHDTSTQTTVPFVVPEPTTDTPWFMIVVIIIILLIINYGWLRKGSSKPSSKRERIDYRL